MTVLTVEPTFETYEGVSQAYFAGFFAKTCPCEHCPGHDLTTSVERWLAALPVIVLPNGCWQGTGGNLRRGYRMYGVWDASARKMRKTTLHRIVYDLTVAPVVPGLEVDHTCHTSACPGGPTCPHRSCLRPDHLRLITGRENTMRRSVRPGHEGLPPHGTTTRAGSRYKCKCGPCLQANRTYRTKWRAARASA